MEAAMQIAGNLIQGVAGYEAGRYNRDLNNNLALEEERAGAAQEAQVREDARMAIGEQIAGQGGSGFQMGSGAALDALSQSQVNAALDALAVRRDAAGRARVRRVEGAQAYAAGQNQLVQGLLGAGAAYQANRSDWAAARSGIAPRGKPGASQRAIIGRGRM